MSISERDLALVRAFLRKYPAGSTIGRLAVELGRSVRYVRALVQSERCFSVRRDCRFVGSWWVCGEAAVRGDVMNVLANK